MAKLPDECIDTIITDPPYGLEFMGKEWDKLDGVDLGGRRIIKKHTDPTQRRGAMKVRYGYGEGIGQAMQDWHHRWATVALRVAKPGAFMLAFGGTRTWHRLACAIEDAGWELRDTVMYVYGSGFCKNHDISKAIDKAAGAEREVVGPATHIHSRGKNTAFPKRPGEATAEESGRTKHQDAPMLTAPATEAAKLWDGWGTALSPAWEPILVCMKPRDRTFAENALRHGVAGLWIDGGRIETHESLDGGAYAKQGSARHDGTKNWRYKRDGGAGEYQQPSGRWPKNLILDGSEEVLALFPTSSVTGKRSARSKAAQVEGTAWGTDNHESTEYAGDSGSAARFYYTAKAAGDERWFFCHDCQDAYPKSKRDHHWHGHVDEKGEKTWKHLVSHPTVKPLALMEYLCRLTMTPTGGVVFDPFCGSGTTCVAAKKLGRNYLGCDTNAAYVAISNGRLSQVQVMLPGMA
jgi:site-specific DNA-methyltransferase (adenine-specific)